MKLLRSIVDQNSVDVHGVVLEFSGDTDGAVTLVRIVPCHIVGDSVVVTFGIDLPVQGCKGT